MPACSVNGPEGGADALCGMAANSCPGEDEIRFTDYQRLVQVDGSRGDWESTGTVCRGPDEPSGVVAPEITPQMVVDQATSLAPVSEITVEPEAETFVHLPTNFSTTEDGATETVYLFGQPIEVTFTPTDYAWDFGDGTTDTGAGIENADIGQPGAVEHGYPRADDYEVPVTRTFTAAFTLPDGQDVSIPGQISTTSDPYPLAVGEIQSLVTDVR